MTGSDVSFNDIVSWAIGSAIGTLLACALQILFEFLNPAPWNLLVRQRAGRSAGRPSRGVSAPPGRRRARSVGAGSSPAPSQGGATAAMTARAPDAPKRLPGPERALPG